MKRNLLAICICILSVLGITAQNPSLSGWQLDYQGSHEETNVFFDVQSIIGEGETPETRSLFSDKGFELAAFIDGELRGLYYTAKTGDSNVNVIRVKGKSGTDDNKKIVMKICDYSTGLIYEMTQMRTQNVVWVNDETTIGTNQAPVVYAIRQLSANDVRVNWKPDVYYGYKEGESFNIPENLDIQLGSPAAAPNPKFKMPENKFKWEATPAEYADHCRISGDTFTAVTAIVDGMIGLKWTFGTLTGELEQNISILPADVHPTAITVPETMTVGKGENFTIFPIDFIPENTTNQAVRYITKDPGIVNVVETDNGPMLQAVAPGMCPVQVLAVDQTNGVIMDECMVTVVSYVTNITLNTEVVQIVKGETATVQYTLTPADASDKTVSYELGRNEQGAVEFVSVDPETQTLVFKGVKDGSAFLIVKPNGVRQPADESIQASAIMRVETPVTAINGPEKIFMEIGESFILEDKFTVEPADATNPYLDVKYEVENIVTNTEVELGHKIEAVGNGTTAFVVSSIDYPEVECISEITVGIKAQRIIVDEINGAKLIYDRTQRQKLLVNPGRQFTITASVMPAEATMKDLAWEICDVTGKVQAGGEYIKMVSEVADPQNPNKHTATFQVVADPKQEYSLTISHPQVETPEKFYFEYYTPATELSAPEKMRIELGQRVLLKDFIKIIPDNATYKDIYFELGDQSILAGGELENLDLYIEGEEIGTETVTFSSEMDPDVTANVTFDVVKSPKNIEITKVDGVAPQVVDGVKTLTVGEGDQFTVKAAVTPWDAFDTTVQWSVVDANDRVFDAAGEFVKLVSSRQSPESSEYEAVFKIVKAPSATGLRIKAYNPTLDKADYLALDIEVSVTDLQLSQNQVTAWVGQNFDITVTILPEDAVNKDYVLEFSAGNILSHTIEGNVIHFTAAAKGFVDVFVSSVANPDVVELLEVQVKQPVESISFNLNALQLWYGSPGTEELPVPKFTPENADFDPAKLTYTFSNGTATAVPSTWELASIQELPDGKVIVPNAIFEGGALIAKYDISDQNMKDPELTATVTVNSKEFVDFTGGWGWYSFITGPMDVRFMKYALEVRSQTQLLYQDPAVGFFGDLTTLEAGQAYKMKFMDMYNDRIYDGTMPADGSVAPYALKKGWNWVGYPYEYAYNPMDVFPVDMLSEGDVILSKNDGMLAVKGKVLSGNMREMKPHQGYMVLHRGEPVSMTWPNRYTLEQNLPTPDQTKAVSVEESVWQYDASRFMNTMGIIGKIQTDAEIVESDYTIGAFVGDECRGEGTVVDGIAYITVGAKGGEEVSFRLYNKFTQEYSEVETVLPFSTLAGTLDAPVALKSRIHISGVDDITEGSLSIYVEGENLYINGYEGVATVVTLGGQVVTSTNENVISIADLSSGVYVVVIDTPEGRITKKFIK